MRSLQALRSCCRLCFKNVSKKPFALSGLKQIRSYPALAKRFYKTTGVIESNGDFEIILDQRKLKTPNGTILKINNELLALGVAKEWDCQKETIDRSSMHLTGLCSTAQDNPNRLNKEDFIQHLVGFLDTDTVLFYSNNDILEGIQKQEWGPVIDWFGQRFEVEVTPTKEIINQSITNEARAVIDKYLTSFDLGSIIGFNFAVESLKSVILTLACVERKLSVDQAVLLSRLEEEYQTKYWGRVEWAHDVNQYDLQSRVAAAVLFIHLTNISQVVKSKLKSIV